MEALSKDLKVVKRKLKSPDVYTKKMTKNIIVLIFIFVVFADTVVFAFNGGMGNFGKRQFDKV